MQDIDAPSCERESDLVAFLYGELTAVEKASFEGHLHTCRLCQDQTSEFRSIRESVMAWRDESLGSAFATVPAAANHIHERKASGLAALRAFFDLSPLWMKGAVGFAAVLFCIFGVLTVGRLRPAPATVVTTKNANSQGSSQQELNALVERRVQEELARRKVVDDQSAPLPASVAVKDKKLGVRSRGVVNQNNEVAAARGRDGKARRPLSKTEREQLAADLRLVSSGNERGVELVDDQINQP
jgi:anti-sigma factor RsiW